MVSRPDLVRQAGEFLLHDKTMRRLAGMAGTDVVESFFEKEAHRPE